MPSGLKKSVSVSVCLPGDGPWLERFGYKKKEREELVAFLQDSIKPNLMKSLSGGQLPENYPWSFIFPAQVLNRKHFYVGAFVVRPGEEEDNNVFAIFSHVTYGWLRENLSTSLNIAFWQARILAVLSKKEVDLHDYISVRDWAKSLQNLFSPTIGLIALNKEYKFSHRANILLSECCDTDYELRSDDGVDVMPWTDWPGCIQGKKCAWLWRQSRHGKIIDSQKIAIKSEQAHKVR